MRSAKLLATLMVGFVPLAVSAQQLAEEVPAGQAAPAAQADPAPTAQAQPTAPVQAQPTPPPAPQPPAPAPGVQPAPRPVPPPPPGYPPPPTNARRGQPGQPGWPGPRRRVTQRYGPTGPMAQHSVRFRPHGPPVKGAFLGVGASPAQEALRKQLQLKPGVGLVVDTVEGGSPAQQAGLREFDVLHKLDDQLLVNPEQFSVLVRTYKPGDEVKLTVIREGKPQVLPAKLGERDFPPLGMGPGEFNVNLFSELIPNGQVEPWTVRLEAAEPQVLNGFDQQFVFVAPGGEAVNAASVLIQDAQHKLTISSKDGRKHLRAEDKAGKIVFDGPVESAEELGKVPTDVRDKILKMGLLGISLPAVNPPAEAPVAPKAPDPAASPSPDPGRVLRLPQLGDEVEVEAEAEEEELQEF